MKTMAAQQAALMNATAEILRAPYRPAVATSPAPEARDTGAEDSSENDDPSDDDDHDTDEAESPATAALRMLEPHLPQLGAFLYEKCAAFLRQVYSKKQATSPATAPSASPTPTAVTPHAAQGPAVTATGTSSSPLETRADAIPVEVAAHDMTTVPTARVPNTPIPTSIVAVPAAGPATSAPFVPTAEQFAHLASINTRLTPKEREIVQSMIAHMDGPTMGQWVGHLSTLSVEDSLALVRKMLADLPPTDGTPPR